MENGAQVEHLKTAKVDIPEKKPSLAKQLMGRMQYSIDHLQPAWREIQLFASSAWPGAAIGSVAAVVAFMAYMGFYLRTGLGTLADVVVSALLGAVGTALLGLVIMLITTIVRAWRGLFTGAILGAFSVFCLLFGFYDVEGPPGLTLRIASTLILILASIGAAVAVMARGRASKVKPSQRIAASMLMILAVAAAVVILVWLASPGGDPYQQIQQPSASKGVIPLAAPNPSEPGSYKVRTLFYGSGADKRRSEYGKLVTLKTNAVDARPFVKELKGFKARLRKLYWGFGADQFPLNGRVWYPEGEGPFPLVLIVHGNHQMEVFSDPGYAYLGELLASRGFITVSVDENFLNLSWSGDIGGENGARGWILLQHLAVWRTWNETKENLFYKKVALSNIALIGHSRGGEAIAHAFAFNKLTHFPDDANVRFNFNFSIKSLIAIGTTDGQYKPADQLVPLENVNYLVLQGSHDGDESSFGGYRPYSRVKFTDGQYWMKSAIYVYRANHGQFNTIWGSYDVGPPLDHLINQKPLLKGGEQRQVAKIYISALLEATLHGNGAYIPMFRDYRLIAQWLPKTIYFSEFQDAGYQVVSDFDNGIDVSKTTVPGGVQLGENLTVWRQQEIKGRFSDWSFRKQAVVLGWDNQKQNSGSSGMSPVASYSLTLPKGLGQQWQLDGRTLLVFSVADTGEDPHQSEEDESQKALAAKRNANNKKEPIDFTLELVGNNGSTARVPLSRFSTVQPIVKVRFTKWEYLEREFYKSPSEPIFQAYELPLSAFVDANSGFDPEGIEKIRFCFDGTKSGVIMLDKVGLGKRELQSPPRGKDDKH